MPSETFEKTIVVNRTPQEIYDYLSHPNSFVRLQPLIRGIYNVQESRNMVGQVMYTYEATEELFFFGLVKYDNHLRVTMTLADPGRIILQEVEAPLSVRLKQLLKFNLLDDGGSEVIDSIELNAPSGLLGYAVRTAKDAHESLLQELKVRMEG